MKLLAVIAVAEGAVLLAAARIAWLSRKPDLVAAEAQDGISVLEAYLSGMSSD